MAKKNKGRKRGGSRSRARDNCSSNRANNTVPPGAGKPPLIGHNQDIEDLLGLHSDRRENGEWVSFHENDFMEECPFCLTEALRLLVWAHTYGFLLENEADLGEALAFDDSTLRVIRFYHRQLGWGAIFTCSRCDTHGIHLSSQPEESSE
ncbi:hypothetical protein EFD56_13870 [Rhizobium phaseoli]|uniref:hypothetical protein n=1 Tax=Rhizobium phaseoli TaxID=396 RepID=UPI000F86BCC8|nr:hypothetical protein [Rhizobium phaseoli]RUM18551.1 hypothetical protein EFD56_13870 [Rhizobium phaseoli]